jgi:hypothetical protein
MVGDRLIGIISPTDVARTFDLAALRNPGSAGPSRAGPPVVQAPATRGEAAGDASPGRSEEPGER